MIRQQYGKASSSDLSAQQFRVSDDEDNNGLFQIQEQDWQQIKT